MSKSLNVRLMLKMFFVRSWSIRWVVVVVSSSSFRGGTRSVGIRRLLKMTPGVLWWT